MPPGGIIPFSGHQLPSVLLPPIRMIGCWSGARPFSRFSRTGSIASGLLPVYWCTARTSNETPTNPSGIEGPDGVVATEALRTSAAAGVADNQPRRAGAKNPASASPSATRDREQGTAKHRRMVAHGRTRVTPDRRARSARPLDASSCSSADGGLGAHRSGCDHRVLGRREVDRDGGVRGRRVLLRGQPAAGDDPLAGRSVHALGREGGARGGRLRRSRPRALRGPDRDARRAAVDRRPATGSCSSRPTRRRCCVATRRPADGTRWRRGARSRPGSRGSASCWRRCASGPTS